MARLKRYTCKFLFPLFIFGNLGWQIFSIITLYPQHGNLFVKDCPLLKIYSIGVIVDIVAMACSVISSYISFINYNLKHDIFLDLTAVFSVCWMTFGSFGFFWWSTCITELFPLGTTLLCLGVNILIGFLLMMIGANLVNQLQKRDRAVPGIENVIIPPPSRLPSSFSRNTNKQDTIEMTPMETGGERWSGFDNTEHCYYENVDLRQNSYGDHLNRQLDNHHQQPYIPTYLPQNNGAHYDDIYEEHGNGYRIDPLNSRYA